MGQPIGAKSAAAAAMIAAMRAPAANFVVSSTARTAGPARAPARALRWGEGANVGLAAAAAATGAVLVRRAAARRPTGACSAGAAPRAVATSVRRSAAAEAAVAEAPAAAVPSWEEMRGELLNTNLGRALLSADEERDSGLRSHTDAKVRYFGEGREKPRITLYRDQAAWCPYCQKVWLLLEGKRVDYATSKV